MIPIPRNPTEIEDDIAVNADQRSKGIGLDPHSNHSSISPDLQPGSVVISNRVVVAINSSPVQLCYWVVPPLSPHGAVWPRYSTVVGLPMTGSGRDRVFMTSDQWIHQ